MGHILYDDCRRWLWIIGLLIQGSIAADLGTHGPLFVIEEEDLMEVIQRKLSVLEKTGAIQRLTDQLQRTMASRIENPPGAHLLPQGATVTVRYVDPSIVTKTSIQDHKGRVAVRKGTRLNPLDFLNWGEPLLLFDGTEAEQITWARAHKGTWVLIQGPPFKLSHAHNRWVYFDQGGSIVKRFQITHLPARISQEGKRLRVEEGI